jgi:hypothetical protein
MFRQLEQWVFGFKIFMIHGIEKATIQAEISADCLGLSL